MATTPSFVTAGGQLWACGRGKHGALGIGVKGTHSCYYYYEEISAAPRGVPTTSSSRVWCPCITSPSPRTRRRTPTRCRASATRSSARSSDSRRRERGPRTPRTKTSSSPRRPRGKGRTEATPWERLGSSSAISAKAKNREAIRALYDDAKKKNAEEDWEGRTPKNGVWIKVPCACGDRCKVVRAAAGGNHSAVLTSCGAVMTTGSNSYGQLGHGDVKRRYAFTRVESLRGSRLVTVDCGEDHTGAVGDAGRLYLWGRGDWGQLGSGTAARTGPRRRSTACPSPLPSRGNTSGRTTARVTSTRTSACAGRRRRRSGRWAARTNTFRMQTTPPPSTNPREGTVAMKGKRGGGTRTRRSGALEYGGNQRWPRRTMESVAAWRGWGRATGRLEKSRPTREKKRKTTKLNDERAGAESRSVASRRTIVDHTYCDFSNATRALEERASPRFRHV